MKAYPTHITRALLLAILFFATPKAWGQGRVVINEYLPWPANSCGTSSEFVELLNFGPGPADISCFILTNGKYAITIPPNTILAPGQFYVLAGQDYLYQGCGNINATVAVDLNWSDPGLTNIPIPVTGEGFMEDGGFANVNLALLNSSLQVIDAVTRSTPLPPDQNINTANPGGQCVDHHFQLSTLHPVYEELGMATGIANSFARKLDGDCGWEKDPQQSAGSTNNTSGATTDINYDFYILSTMDCQGQGGKISITVKHGDVSSLFPMNYTIGYDSDFDGDFDFGDAYTYGEDYSPPEVIIDNLPAGSYVVTIASSRGCYLRNFSFTILPCYPVLPVKLVYFRKGREQLLEWLLTDTEQLQSVTVEKRLGRSGFTAVHSVSAGASWSGSRYFSYEAGSEAAQYRLKIITRNGSSFYSPVLSTNGSGTVFHRAGPNPAKDVLELVLSASEPYRAGYFIYNTSGAVVLKGQLEFKPGVNTKSLPVAGLAAGVYQLQILPPNGLQQPISFRFVKH